MAKNDFKYVINTELKLNTGSLKKLLDDIKDVDTSIKNHFNKTGGAGIKLPVSIDKTASLNRLQTEVRQLVTSYNSYNAPSIKLKVEVDKTSVNKLKADISRLKTQINNLDNDSKSINVKTSLKVDREDRAKLQREVGNIKSTMTVGLKLDQNDLKAVQAQIKSIREEVIGDRTRMHNGQPIRSLRDHVQSRNQSVGATRSTADREVLNARGVAQAEKDLASARRQNAQAEKTEIQNSRVKNKAREEEAKRSKENISLDEQRLRVMQMAEQQERRLANLREAVSNKNTRDNLGNRGKRRVLGTMSDIQNEIESLKAERKRIEDEIYRASAKTRGYNEKLRNNSHVDPYDTNAQKLREQSERNYTNFLAQERARQLQIIENAHKEAKKMNTAYDRDKERQRRDYEWNNALTRYGGNRQHLIRDDEMILRDPSRSEEDKNQALERLKRNASDLARTMGQNLTRSFEMVSTAEDGNIVRTRTAQYEFTRFGQAVDRSNRALATIRNTLQYTALSATFYEMAQGIALSVRHMAELESQIARVEMVSTNFSTGNIKEVYSQYGTEKTIGTRTRKDVYDIAQKYGMSATQNVMPVYQDVMSRYDLTAGENGQSNPKLAKYITDQIMKYSMITLGPGAQADDISRISQDIMSMYQALNKNSTGVDHVYEMDGLIDYMTNMNMSGVNTNNIMDAMGEIAPDVIKKGIDVRDVAGLLGAYNLSDTDISGSALTTVAKTFFGSLAKANSSTNVQKGLSILGIDPSGKTTQELFDEVLANYSSPEMTDASKAEVSMLLSSTSGNGGKAQAPRVQKLLDAYSSSYYNDFQAGKNDTGLADEALLKLTETLKSEFGQLTQEAGEFVALMSELGAMDGLKLLVDGLGGVLKGFNFVLDKISQFGAEMENLTGFNLPKALTQIIAITGALKGMSLVMKKLQIANGISGLLSTVLGVAGTTSATGGAGGALLLGGRRATLNRTRMSGTLTNTANITRRIAPTPATSVGGFAGKVGSFIGNALGWVVGGRLATARGRGLMTDAGRNIASTRGNQIGGVLARFGNGMKGILPNLLKFGSILGRLSAIGLVVTGVIWAGKAISDHNKKQKQETAREQAKSFKATFGDMSLVEDNEVKNQQNAERYEEFKSKYDEYKKLYLEHQEKLEKNPQPEATYGMGYFTPVEKDPRLAELEKEFEGSGISFKTNKGYQYQKGNISTNQLVMSFDTGEVDSKTGKPIYEDRVIDLADSKKEEALLKEKTGRTPLTEMEKMQKEWDLATQAALEYESELFKIEKMTSQFNKAMQQLSYTTSKIEFSFLGAEDSQGSLNAQIGAIETAMFSLGDVIDDMEAKKKLFAEGSAGIQTDMNAYRTKLLTDGVLSSKELSDLDTRFEMAYANGDSDSVLSQYEASEESIRNAIIDRNKKANKDWTEEDWGAKEDKEVSERLESNTAISMYLATKQTAEGFTDAEKQAEEAILANNIAIQQQETALKKLRIALGVARSGYEEFNAKISQIQNVVGKAQTMLSLTDDDDSSKIQRQADYMKALSTELNAYRSQLGGVQREMSRLKSANPNEDFSISALYNPGEDGLSEQQAIFKELMEKYNGIHTNINSSTTALKEQGDALKEMVLNSDKYADVWERVQNRIQLVKDMNKDIASNRLDMSLVNQFSDIRSAITGESKTDVRASRYEQIRDKSLDNYEQIITSLKTYAGDEKKLQEAYAEINKTMGSEFDTAFIQPLKDIISGDLTDAGNLIYDGADKLDQVLSYWGTNMANVVNLSSQNSQFSSDITSAVSIGGFSGGSVNTSDMSDQDAISAYIEQQFGYKKGSADYGRMLKLMQSNMTKSEMVSTAKAGIVSTGNNANVNAYANKIDDYFSDTNRTKLKGYGSQFVSAGSKYGIDPMFLASIAVSETGGTSSVIDKAYNIGNIKATGSANAEWGGGSVTLSDGLKYRKYDSMQEGINDLARLLKDVYFSQGYDTIPEINSKYAEDPNWKNNVASIYSRLSGIPTSDLLGGTSVSSGGSSGGGSSSGSSSGSSTYTVKKGDTLSGIASKYSGVSWQEIQKANGNISPTKLQIGQKLKIPGQGGGSSSSSSSGSGIAGSSSKTQEVAKYYTSGNWYYSSLMGDGRGHKGVDISLPGEADNGTKAMAFLGGTVARTGYQANGAGNYIVIKQDDGSEQKYMHLKSAPKLKSGDKVSAGDTIGQIGSTGQSSGSHLHYEMWDKNGNLLNPKDLISDWANGKGINSGSKSTNSVTAKNEATPAELIKLASQSLKDAVNAQLQIDSINTLKSQYKYDENMAYGSGNIRDVLGTTGRISVADRVIQERENVYSARYSNVQQLKELASNRKEFVKDANSALKAGKTDEYKANKEAVSAIDKLVKTLEENNKKLASYDIQLAKQQRLDPRLNSTEGTRMIIGGNKKVGSLDVGSVDYYRTMEEVSTMNSEYMTTDKKNSILTDYWNQTGLQTNQYNWIKRANDQNNIDLVYQKLKNITGVINDFAQGTQSWYSTLEDVVSLYQQVDEIEQQRLANAKAYFETTGKGASAYIQQSAYVTSKEYNQTGKNLAEAQKALNSGELQDTYKTQLGTGNYSKNNAERIQKVLKEDFNTDASIKKNNKTGKYYLETNGDLSKEQADYISKELKNNESKYGLGGNLIQYSKTKKTQDGGKMDAEQELATMQIIAGLHDQMIQQMNDYRSAVVGAFKAGSLSLDEYIQKMSNLRDVQNEQRENAVKMVDTISQGFEQSLSEALSNGMMGNMDSTQGFIDGIKQTLASTVSAQLSNTIINNTGLQSVMTGLISSITDASTSGDPNDILNMFNNNNFGEQIQNAIDPFLPLIEQIVSSTDGIFSIMKDQLFNATEGFKIDSYLYDQAKGKSVEGIKDWTQNGETNEAGSPIGGIGSNTPITAPEADAPTGVPTGTSTPTTGTSTQDAKPVNTTGTSTGKPNSSDDVQNPKKNDDKVNTAPKTKPKKPKTTPKPKSTTYTVKKGDTLSEIGSKLGVSWKDIASWNGIKSPYTIYVGQKLKINGGSGGGSTTKKSSNTKTVKTSLNMRSSPAYGNNVIKTLPKGAKVEYLGLEKGWAKVKYSGKTGYVGKNYIYHSGGIAGMMNFTNAESLKSNEIKAIMQKGEIALQPKQLSSLIGNAVPSSNTNNNGDIHLTVQVNVEGGNYDQRGIEGVVQTSVEKAMSEFKRQQRLGNLSIRGTSY